MGSDGTVGANKEAVKIIASQPGMHAQGEAAAAVARAGGAWAGGVQQAGYGQKPGVCLVSAAFPGLVHTCSLECTPDRPPPPPQRTSRTTHTSPAA
jgi:hypothetical protein